MYKDIKDQSIIKKHLIRIFGEEVRAGIIRYKGGMYDMGFAPKTMPPTPTLEGLACDIRVMELATRNAAFQHLPLGFSGTLQAQSNRRHGVLR